MPALRFPEFTEEWEKCKLGDITINFNLRNKDRISYPMYSVTNNRGFVPQSEQFEDREMIGEDIKAYKIIHKNDFAYNPARINVGSIAKYNGDNPCMISSLYVCFKSCNIVDADWLMQLLKTSKMNFYYNVNGEGGVRIYLFYPNFARISTSYPKIAEQKKIAKFLSLIDERIATQNRIIEKLETLIKGIVKKTFVSTQYVPLLHYSPIITSGKDKDNGGIYPLYGSSGIIGCVPKPSYNKTIVLIARVGSIGNVQYVTTPCGISDNTLIIDAGEENRFIYYYLNVYNFNHIISGTTQPLITASSVKNIEIPVIEKQRRKKIVSTLYAIEQKLRNEKYIAYLLSRQKYFLLSQMFI